MSNEEHNGNAISLTESEATRSGAFLRILPNAGVLRAIGGEFPDLLHRLSTNEVLHLKPGQCGETILTNEKGRVIDVVLVLPRSDETLLLTSAGKMEQLLSWFDKYTIMEDVRYEDASGEYLQMEINGGGYQSVPLNQFPVTPWSCNEMDADTILLHHHSVMGAGLRFLNRGKNLKSLEIPSEIPKVSPEAHNLWRVKIGLPAVGYELTEKFNPLESGAGIGVSFTKGCYIGQEVIARLDSYDKVQRHLKKLRVVSEGIEGFEGPVTLMSESNNAGFLTSVVHDPVDGSYPALGLVRLAYEKPGTKLTAHIADNVYNIEVLEDVSG